MTPSTWEVHEAVAPLALDVRCTLGEGLLWDTARRRWWWTDIEASCVWTWAGPGHMPVRCELPDRLGSFALCRSGRLLLGLAKGLAWGREHDGRIEVSPAVPVEAAEPRTRINDGRTDREGRFVFGTFNQAAEKRPICGFYQFSLRHGLRRLALPAVAIANSICFSPDGRTMYFTDTAQGRILQCDYDGESASVSRLRDFVAVQGGGPDGSVVDAEGCLWNAQWGAARVVRYSPKGEPLMSVSLAAPHASCPAFGGDGLHELTITSARAELDATALARWPESGGLFQLKLPAVTGLADALFED
jgi:sugar lactone lactonase YvrE